MDESRGFTACFGKGNLNFDISSVKNNDICFLTFKTDVPTDVYKGVGKGQTECYQNAEKLEEILLDISDLPKKDGDDSDWKCGNYFFYAPYSYEGKVMVELKIPAFSELKISPNLALKKEPTSLQEK